MNKNRASFAGQVDFWNSVINPDNITIGELNLDEFKLEENLVFYQTPVQDYAYRVMGNIEGKNVLELGCGMGMNAVIMAGRGANVTAIDIAQKRVNWVNGLAKRYGLKNIKAICMSAEDLDFPDESFDIIYSNEVLIHLNHRKVLGRCVNLLRKGSKAIFVESLKFNPLVNLYRCTLAPRIFKHIGEHFTFKEIDSFRTFFPQVYHKEFYLFSFMAFFWQFGVPNLSLFKLSVTALNRIYKLIFLCFPFTRIFAWMSCIECIK